MLEQFADAFNNRDLDALADLGHPDAEFVPTGLITPAGAAYHGREGLKSANDHILGELTDVQVVFGKPEALGRWALVEVKFTGTGNPEIEGVPTTVLIEFEGPRMRRALAYANEDEARAAAYAAGAPVLTPREREIFR